MTLVFCINGLDVIHLLFVLKEYNNAKLKLVVSGRYTVVMLPGGETGIRTLGRLPFNGFQDRRNRPLCHLSGREYYMNAYHFANVFL